MVERFFRDITEYLRDDSFSSVREHESSITTFLALRKCAADSLRLERQREDILNQIRRAREATASQA